MYVIGILKLNLPDTWEQRQLGRLGSTKSGTGFPDIEQGGKIGLPFYKVSDMNIIQNSIEMVLSNNYVTVEQIKKYQWKPIYDVPAIFFAKVGAAVLLNRKRICTKPFLLDNNTMVYSINTKYLDHKFTYYLFTNIDLTKFIQVGALPSIKGNDIESFEVYIPIKDEQYLISKFIHSLDNLITLHQY